MATKKYELDMTKGPIFKQLLTFTIPLILSGILQLLYNAADIVVVGNFSGITALAAVGSTGSLINLITGLFMGLSLGVSVVASNYYGGKNYNGVSRVLHTAVTISVIGGIVIGAIGIIIAPAVLKLMGSPFDVLPQAALYMRIYFCGMPFFMLYNFGSAVLRALGDTKRPLYFLAVSGIVNVVLNLFFVILFKMGVAGVALATIIAQAISACFVVNCLMKSDGFYKLELKKLKIHRVELKKMIIIGLPAGIQGSIFSISNVLIQSSINSFGSDTMAGNAAAANIEGFIYVAMNCIYQSALTFIGQNFGAKEEKRITQGMLTCVAMVVVIGLALGILALIFSSSLIKIYNSDPDVIKLGMLRTKIIAPTYFICGIMEVLVGGIRGLGNSILPMIISILGVCGIRIVWLYTIFVWDPSLTTLYTSYPVSWFVTAAIDLICFVMIKKKLKTTYFNKI
ncbi:MAG: MATE family efflux transporter [Clostridia bacterium]|nr:MATE family efflux transporter [Clostridia bacterium]